uniref:GAF domain-containing protein n=1 Tax=Candidatus Kentrum sp. TC TaxID=2126339 RepID=A0A450ZNR1_9GAMM|nr:MAG: GAF domain-containing protein [Candidatus Kentron sp. TC]
MIPQSKTLFQTASELAHAMTGAPVVIWIEDFEIREVRVRGRAGLADGPLMVDAIADRDETGVIAQVMKSGEEKTAPEVRRDPLFHGLDPSRFPDTRAILALPVLSRGGKAIGVIGFLAETRDRLARLDREALDRVTEMVAGQAESSRRIFYLADATRRLIQSRNLNDVAGILAQTAKELTGAHSSVVWLWNERIGQFTHASHAAGMAWSIKPREDGLTHRILQEGDSIKIDNAVQDGRVRPELLKRGVRSQVGAPIQRGEKRIGVLFVNSNKVAHFTANDVYLLETLAGQFSAGFGWGQRLMGPMDEVEEAISRLFDLDKSLDKLCKDIKAEFGFDYVAVQLIHPIARTIETVFGLGQKMDWVGVKHPMNAHADLRDIQVDVARSHPRRIEVLRGWDRRFDRWIYDRFGHKDYARAWVPMILVRDESGEIEEDWWRRARWRKDVDESLSDGGWRFTLKLEGIEDSPPRSYLIGTVDAGYADPQRRITPDQARKLANLVNQGALDVRKTQLPGVLETIAEGARRILDADAASLHFAYNPDQKRNRFAYEVTAGKDRLRFYHHNKPGHHELWRQAIAEERPRFVPDESRQETDRDLESFAPNLYGQGIRAIAAFPFVVDDNQSVLYVYFETPHRFTEDELRWAESFVRRAERAVRDAISVLRSRDQNRLLSNLHEIARSLITDPESPDLPRDIAGYVASILGADIVTIYEYFEIEDRFTGPARVGRLLDAEKVLVLPERKDAIQFRVLGESEPVYAEMVEKEAIFRGTPGDFIDREKILSAIACPLEMHGETVGVMFINYRARRQFTEDDRTMLVPTLAASAAMAIQVARSYHRVQQELDRRTRETNALYRVDKATAGGTANLQQALDVILREAVNITKAQVGYFLRYDRWQDRLDLVSEKGLPKEQRRTSQTLDTGIIGLAASTRRPQFAPDVSAPGWKGIYNLIVPETRAEIAVPLLDENDLWGVLNVESPKLEAFTREDLAALERFARQAMITVREMAIHSKRGRQIGPLHFLSIIASRIQDPRYDLDTVLRLLLTGVTSDQGLSFSRAMLFLIDGGGDRIRGKMAIGQKGQKEADEIWRRFIVERDEAIERGKNIPEWVLDKAEKFGEEENYPLTQAVRQISLMVVERMEGALTQCVKKRKSVVVRDNQLDSFRNLLKQKGAFPDSDGTFACVPLIGRESPLGAIVVDYQFLQRKWTIDDTALSGLDAYAKVMAMAIENTRLRETMEKQREATWRYFARQTAHSIGNRISQIEGPIFQLQDACEHQDKDWRRGSKRPRRY